MATQMQAITPEMGDVQRAADGDHRAELTRLVRRWNRRLRLQQSVVWLPRALIPGLALGVILELIARLQPLALPAPMRLPGQILLAALGATAVGLVLAALVVWLWPRPHLAAARRFDLVFGLRERVSSAFELLDGRIKTTDELASRQLNDARQHAKAVRPAAHLPLTLRSRDWIIILLTGALLALLLILPNPQADALAQNAAQQAALQQAQQDLRQITENVAAQPNLTDEQRQNLLQTLQTSTDTLRQPDISPEEALATVSDAQAALQNQANQANQQSNGAQTAMQGASDALQQYAPQGSSAATEQANTSNGLSDSLHNLSQSMNTTNPQQLQQAAQAASQAAQSLQNSQSPQLQQAAQQLQQAAQQAQQGNTAAAQNAVQQAQQNVQQAEQQQAQQQTTAQQLQQAAQQAQQDAGQIAQSSQQGQQSQQNANPNSPQQNQPGQGQQAGQQPNGQQSGQQPSQQAGQSQLGDGALQAIQQAGQQNGQPSQQQVNSQGNSQGNQSGSLSQGQQALQQQGNTPNQQSAGPSNASQSAGDSPGSNNDNVAPAAGSNQQITQNNNPDGQGTRPYDSVYDPTHIGGQGSQTMSLDPGDSNVPMQEGNFTQNPNGSANVPYNQVFSNYQNAANQALQSDYIPLGLRDMIRNYFSSLEPGQSQTSSSGSSAGTGNGSGN